MSAVDRLRDAAALRLCRVSVDPADLRDVLVYYDDHEHKARAAEAEVARLRREQADADAHNARAAADYLARFGHDANCGGPAECGCMVAEIGRGCMAEVVREVARLRAIVDAVRHEHATRAAWLATLPACASAPADVLAAEAATAQALARVP